MNTRTLALVLGVGFVVAALAGFFPSPPSADALPLTIEHGHGLAVGLLPATNTTFGLIPIYGADVALHGIIGLVAAYFGFMAPAAVDARR